MQKTFTFKDGHTVPTLGFGTWQLKGDDCVTAVDTALSTGYRHIDTADGYHNHEAVARGIAKSGIARDEFFLTSKIFPENDNYLPENVTKNVDRFLQELETDYLDLLLLHWPDRSVPLGDTLAAMSNAVEAGKVRSLGVSNFTEHHLTDAAEIGYEPVCNQVEMHPGFPQRKLRSFCKDHGIAVTAYSPLGRGKALEKPLITELAEKYDKTSGQICINWALATGAIAIPKSSSPERIIENFAAQSFTMEQADIDAIDTLNDGDRIIDPPFGDFDY